MLKVLNKCQVLLDCIRTLFHYSNYPQLNCLVHTGNTDVNGYSTKPKNVWVQIEPKNAYSTLRVQS